MCMPSMYRQGTSAAESIGDARRARGSATSKRTASMSRLSLLSYQVIRSDFGLSTVSPDDPKAALTLAFEAMQEGCPESGGSTAVVVLTDSKSILCANVGDSRAVLSRDGSCIPLSEDHKLKRQDEEDRVLAEGGFISRDLVAGVLAMTRVLGNRWIPGVSHKPDITVLDRDENDEFIISASDGLWDVMSSQEAVHIVRRCINRAISKGISENNACSIASKVLVRVAFHRRTRDNVTVLIHLLSALSN